MLLNSTFFSFRVEPIEKEGVCRWVRGEGDKNIPPPGGSPKPLFMYPFSLKRNLIKRARNARGKTTQFQDKFLHAVVAAVKDNYVTCNRKNPLCMKSLEELKVGWCCFGLVHLEIRLYVKFLRNSGMVNARILKFYKCHRHEKNGPVFDNYARPFAATLFSVEFVVAGLYFCTALIIYWT